MTTNVLNWLRKAAVRAAPDVGRAFTLELLIAQDHPESDCMFGD
ncbi:hypothetical protein [Herbaspirillum huttiense]